MKKTLKWPLIVSLVVIGARILLEEMGAPNAINNILGVAWLSFLIPVYLAVRLASSGEEHPYKAIREIPQGPGDVLNAHRHPAADDARPRRRPQPALSLPLDPQNGNRRSLPVQELTMKLALTLILASN